MSSEGKAPLTMASNLYASPITKNETGSKQKHLLPRHEDFAIATPSLAKWGFRGFRIILRQSFLKINNQYEIGGFSSKRRGPVPKRCDAVEKVGQNSLRGVEHLPNSLIPSLPSKIRKPSKDFFNAIYF